MKSSFKHCRICPNLPFQPSCTSFLLTKPCFSQVACLSVSTSVYFPECGYFVTLYREYVLFALPITQNTNSSISTAMRLYNRFSKLHLNSPSSERISFWILSPLNALFWYVITSPIDHKIYYRGRVNDIESNILSCVWIPAHSSLSNPEPVFQPLWPSHFPNSDHSVWRFILY